MTSSFSFSHNVFYPFGKRLAFFIKFETVSCLQTLAVWKGVKFVVWERVKVPTVWRRVKLLKSNETRSSACTWIFFPSQKTFYSLIGHFSRFWMFFLSDQDVLALVMVISSTGRRPASLCHGPVSVVRPCVRASVRPSVRPSVRALTFSLNIFFAETTYRILMKFHRNVSTMVLFRIS